MRRGRAPFAGSSYSRMTSVFGSMLPILLALNSSKYGTPFESRRTPYGREFTVGASISLMLPPGTFGSSDADEVAGLHGEEEPPVAKKRDGMRILRLRVGHLVFGDLAGLRVDHADEPGGVAGVPDVAVRVGLQAVRTRVRRRQRELLELLRCAGSKRPMVLARCAVYQIEPSGATGGIVRVRRLARGHPVVELDVDVVGDRRARPAPTRRARRPGRTEERAFTRIMTSR